MSILSSIWPFVAVVVGLAILPGIAPHLWESPLKRAGLLALPSAAACWQLGARAPHVLSESMAEYIAFMALLCSLYGVAGGILLEGGLKKGPISNLIWLAAGALGASVLGTTGASMLLIRPFVRAQAHRPKTAHTVVFFIIIVSNVGGMLLPLGDPPLYLGYLKGVPFLWTLKLWPAWLVSTTLLLALFYVLDRRAFAQEPKSRPVPREPLSIKGGHNLLFFAALVALVGLGPTLGLGHLSQSASMLAVLAASMVTTPKSLYRANSVSAAPMIEVATVFLALFITMPEALAMLVQLGPRLGPLGPEAYFWITGTLSALLDNAPCYLTMATLAQAQVGLSGSDLGMLAAHPAGEPALLAIAQGAVAMGAMTYIGNGPNLMVRAVANQSKLATPSFAGYLGWTIITLAPVLAFTRLLLGYTAGL